MWNTDMMKFVRIECSLTLFNCFTT